MKKIYTIILLTLCVSVANATIHLVTVLSSSFSSATVTAVCGDTIAWQWTGGVHTTTSTSVPSCATAWDAPIDAGNPGFAIVIPCAGTFIYECTPHGFTGTIIATCATGINAASANENSPTVSPNPSADGIFNVSFGKNENMFKRIYITGTDGKKIMDENILSVATNHIINLQSYAEGIYFLVMEGAKGRRVMKLVR